MLYTLRRLRRLRTVCVLIVAPVVCCRVACLMLRWVVSWCEVRIETISKAPKTIDSVTFRKVLGRQLGQLGERGEKSLETPKA